MTLQVTQAAITEICRLHQHRQAEATSEGKAAKSQDIAASETLQAQLDVVPGGCAEQRYRLKFDRGGTGSQAVNCGAVELHISQTAWPHVQQLTLDYVEDLMGGSFRFDNPQLPDTCNCGQSFRFPPSA